MPMSFPLAGISTVAQSLPIPLLNQSACRVDWLCFGRVLLSRRSGFDTPFQRRGDQLTYPFEHALERALLRRLHRTP